MGEVTCAVPGCGNVLSEEQKEKKIVVCFDCESADLHKCDTCGKEISVDRLRDGASLCRECGGGSNEAEGEEEYEEYMSNEEV